MEQLRVFAFNTGRSYTEFGQRIAVGQLDTLVFFVDIDRQIEGVFEYDFGNVDRQIVMATYDRGWYRAPARYTEQVYSIVQQLWKAAKEVTV